MGEPGAAGRLVRLSAGSTPGADASPPAGGCAVRGRLANGLEVIVLENHVVPLVTVEIDVHNGSYTETEDYNGLSHLYEHMFFKANERLPDQERYLRRTRELGMEWNGTTSEERVNYYFTLPSASLEEGMRFLSDAVRTPLFLPEELEREREVVLGEYDRAESDPSYHLFVEVSKALWYRHYTRKNVLGSRSAILAASRDKMLDIKRRFYIPNNSALLVAGDVDPDTAMRLAASVFGDWEPGPDPFASRPVPPHPPLERSTAQVIEWPVQAVTLLMSWHGPSVEFDTAATLAADVFSFVLGQRNSRFYRRLVDSGLAASASLHYQTLRYTGPIQLHLRTTADRFQAARAALLDEIEHFVADDSCSDEELQNAKNQLEIDLTYEAERPSQLVHTLGYWWAVADLRYYLDYVSNLRRVRREDVLEFVRRYILARPCVTGILVSPQERRQLGIETEEAR